MLVMEVKMLHKDLLAGATSSMTSPIQSELTVGDMIASGTYKLIVGIETVYRAIVALLQR